DLQDYPIYLGHADAPELAAQLADMIRSRFGSEIEIITVQVNPTTGAHCGPDTTGVCFHAKHR
ncbi:MAG: DegV family protein, partial [Bacteroidales bacterium]|nr:DegV family protein [Bacteroidales bacterium]